MKILFPIEYYYPSDIGGPANALYWHTQMLKANGIDSVVVTSDVGITNKSVTRDEWITDGENKVIYCSGGRLSPQIFINTIDEIRKCDVLHLSSVCYPYNIFFFIYARMKKKRVIISPRGELFQQAYLLKRTLMKKVLFFVYRIFQRKFLFHATSIEEKENIIKIFPKAKIVIQPNLINVRYSEAPQNRGDDIIFLGRITCIKAVDKLIKALPLSHSFMESHGKLVIVGCARLPEDITYKKKLEEIIAKLSLTERVVFVGIKTGEEKFRILNFSKVLVLPSESENFGNVVTEALSQSTPVIASKGTPWQILEEKNIGWWTNNTPEELAKSIDKLYSLSVAKYQEYCINAKKYVEDYLDIKKSKYNEWPIIYDKY